ncbi:uncharacterized protein LOC114532976 [Dendronephthya gigantea]|uniref:uncharacterized protein LOC114532976 n=1 Tax=Dendronephthya gigantea TaxID=151771 RepID=UPI001069F85C|nr:uncharacterized protein LOC114532976 [Dendronephthya gigantea]
MMRTINFRHNVEQTRFVIFPGETPNMSVLVTVLESMGIEWDIAYYHCNPVVLQESCSLTKSTHPLILTKTCQPIKGDDLFTQSADEFFAEKDTGITHQRQFKPVKLYVKLLNLFVQDKTLYVVDACGGSGSYVP